MKTGEVDEILFCARHASVLREKARMASPEVASLLRNSALSLELAVRTLSKAARQKKV